MVKVAMMIFGVAFLTACSIPKVRLVVETRDPQNSVIERGEISNAATSGREFRINSGGSIVFNASADDTDGLATLDVLGGFSCNRSGTVQQGVFNSPGPNLSAHPTSANMQATYQVQCVGGTYTGSAQACATSAKNASRSCTPNATFK